MTGRDGIRWSDEDESIKYREVKVIRVEERKKSKTDFLVI